MRNNIAVPGSCGKVSRALPVGRSEGKPERQLAGARSAYLIKGTESAARHAGAVKTLVQRLG